MADTAAGLLGGDGGAAGAVADAGGAAGATAAAGGTAAAGSTAAAGGSDWRSGLSPDDRAWVEAKGFKDGAAAAVAFRNLEKVMGGEKLPRPKGDDDAAGWDATYKALGRPDKPDDYKLPVPDGGDGAFAKEAAPVLHKLGLSQKQAAGLAEWWNTHATKVQADAAAAQATASEAEMVQLKQEWGGQYDANVEAGRRAARQFGLDAAAIGKIESGLGSAATIKLLTKLGLALGEDPGPAGKGTQSFGSTKEQAQHQINQKKLDKDFMAAYFDPRNPGNAAAKQEMERLHQIAAS